MIPPQRKIIHVDMDCFYAAIEMRDDPTLADKAIAVGGSSERGVVCTCNYAARQFGVRSAMSTGKAYSLCPELIVLPVNMAKYREAAQVIRSIFYEFTDMVEPLSLDEAYLDVTGTAHCNGSATLIAKAIRAEIKQRLHLTASAGVAPNKFLAKIASGWRKPDGLFVIKPEQIQDFVKELDVKDLHGVGKVTAKKLHDFGLFKCTDVQATELPELIQKFGKFGLQLYEQSHGIDNRAVQPNRIRKSLSVEETFSKNISTLNECENALAILFSKLNTRLRDAAEDRPIKNQYIKIKYSNFTQQTIERSSATPDITRYHDLLKTLLGNRDFEIRLLGVGVHFQESNFIQQTFW